MRDDEALVRAAGSDDDNALEELVRRLAPRIHEFMTAMLGDGRAAAEATQDAFVRLARAVGGFSGGDVEAWAFGLARRVAADQILWRSAVSPGPFGSLAHQHREVLVMRETLEWDLRRIARILEISLDDVHRRLLDARDALVPSRVAPVREAPA